MVDGVELEEVILAAVSGYLELGAKANDGAGFLGLGDGVLDVVQIAIKFHRPLVQIAGGDLQQPHLPQNGRSNGGATVKSCLRSDHLAVRTRESERSK